MVTQGALTTVSSADVAADFGARLADTRKGEITSVALIGPDKERRSAVARALAETRKAAVREFDSYPWGPDHLQKLLTSFDVILLDLDSNHDAAFEIVEKTSAEGKAAIMVYSEKADPKVAVRLMRAGARELLLLPLEKEAVAEALGRTTSAIRRKPLPAEKKPGELLVFVSSKGGSGVTTVACNVAVALAQETRQKILLIDLALPIGDAALCLGISADYSAEDALRNIDRLDASFLRNLVVMHRSGVFVLAAPTKVSEFEVSKSAIERLIGIARREFDHVVVDVGSRTDAAAKALFEDASTVFLVTQSGISELRNSNCLISQFFSEGRPNLEIVINRFDSHFHETVNEEVIAKALGRPVRWKIPNDHDAARAQQCGDTGLAETRISRISLEMASSIAGRPARQERKMDFGLRGLGRSTAQVNIGNDEPPDAPIPVWADASTDEPTTPAITWPTPDPIAYGDKLTLVQLNATASVAGTLAYTPGPGYALPVGTHTLWVTFTPADCGSYTPLQAAISIVVTKATPALTWRTPAEITRGTALGDAQLNASAPVPGRFDYSPATGEVLPPGTHTLSVTFIPADSANYAAAEATVLLTVAKATSAIEWPKPDAITYGTQLGNMQLCATASQPGTFEYNPGPGAALAAGEHRLSVVFTPADTSTYSASQAAVSLTVTKATPAITWQTPDPIAYGAVLGATQLNAAATVPGSFAYSPAAGAILEPGAHELSVKFAPTDTLNYTSARALVLLNVNEKIAPIITWQAPAAICYGTVLNGTHLNATASVPGTFVYTPSAGHVLAPGRYALSAMFTPFDTEKYATAQATVELEVEGSPEVAPLPAAATEVSPETPSARTLTEISLTHADPAPAEAMEERSATGTILRETRRYKGAVYEKGEDGQWHLQKK